MGEHAFGCCHFCFSCCYHYIYCCCCSCFAHTVMFNCYSTLLSRKVCGECHLCEGGRLGENYATPPSDFLCLSWSQASQLHTAEAQAIPYCTLHSQASQLHTAQSSQASQLHTQARPLHMCSLNTQVKPHNCTVHCAPHCVLSSQQQTIYFLSTWNQV